MKDFLLSYDQITLRPRYSTLKSRALADTSMEFGGKQFRLPVVPANMRDVIGIDNAKWLSENDFFYIMHRFDGSLSKTIEISNNEKWKTISVSVGVTEEDQRILRFWNNEKARIDFITIDVAHGHHSNMMSMVQTIREEFPKAFLIAGNVATMEGVDYLLKLKVDAIKVGIGGGSICTTRYMTGFHLPTLHSVKEATELLVFKNLDVPIIADGGAKHYGDIPKAIKFGATMVMSGGWFASCIDSPAKIVDGKKIYRGSTAYESKGERKHVEGRTLTLDEGFTYSDRMKEIQQSLQSAISYAGGSTISSFHLVDWERVIS